MKQNRAADAELPRLASTLLAASLQRHTITHYFTAMYTTLYRPKTKYRPKVHVITQKCNLVDIIGGEIPASILFLHLLVILKFKGACITYILQGFVDLSL